VVGAALALLLAFADAADGGASPGGGRVLSGLDQAFGAGDLVLSALMLVLLLVPTGL
jgi:hypothetical protein